MPIQATVITCPICHWFWDVEHLPHAEEEVPEDAADLGPDLHAPDLTEEGIERPCELPEPRRLQPLQLREEQQQHRGPGVAMRLAAQGQEVGDHLGNRV